MRKEKLLIKILNSFSETKNIKEIKKKLVTETGKALNLQGCRIFEFDKDIDSILPLDEYGEYISSKEIPYGTANIKVIEIHKEIIEIIKQRKEVIFSSPDKLISKYKIVNYKKELLEYYKKNNIKACLILPIAYSNELLGIFAIAYSYEKEFKEEELEFLRILTLQFGAIFYQAQLYEKEKQTRLRQSVIEKISKVVRSSLDIKRVKQTFVSEVGKYLNADRVFLFEFDENKKIFLTVDDYSEYLSEPDMKSFKGFDFTSPAVREICNRAVRKEGIIYSSREEFIERAGLNEEEKNHVYEFDVKSAIAFPLVYRNTYIGVIAIHSVKKYVNYSREDIEFVKEVANQAAIAIIQARLYNKVKQTADREALIRKFIETIRSTLDKNEFQKIAVNEVGKTFGADRCFFRAFDKKTDLMLPVNIQYKSSEDVSGISDFKPFKDAVLTLENIFIQKGVLTIADTEKFLMENNLEKTSVSDYLRTLDVKSEFAVSVWDTEKVKAYLALQYTKKYKTLSSEEIDLLKSLSSQANIAFQQAELFEAAKQSAEAEKVLRETTEIIRSTLDISEIKNTLVKIIGTYFRVDRCFIVENDPETKKVRPISTEYISSSEIDSLLNKDVSGEFRDFSILFNKNDKNNFIMDVKKFIEENKEYLPRATAFLKKHKVKSAYGLRIFCKNIYYGVLIIHFIKEERHLTNDELNFLELFVKQAGTALYQAQLYEKERQTAERESLLRKIVETIRNTLDVDKIKKEIIKTISIKLKADRCLIGEFDQSKGKYIPLRYEYRLSPETSSMAEAGFNPNDECPELAELNKARKDIISRDFQGEFIKENNLEGTLSEKFFKKYDILSGFALPILYGDQFFGTLSYHYKRKIDFSDEDIKFVRTLANQTAIALHQLDLYYKVQATAQKEKLLREIISEIRYSQSLGEAYNYILAKISDLFDTDRCIFLETPNYRYETPSIRYEHIRKKGLSPIKNLDLPKICFDKFKEAGESLKPIEIRDIPKIGSIIAIPLVRYNRHIKLLGIIALCSSRQKEWKTDEIELLKAITGSVVNVVWDITKLIEIEELRNTFTLTLAHDLKVPVIGEKKALEFINSRPEDMQIKNIKPIIKDLLDNNMSINNMLSKLIEIYNYEIGNKDLDYSKQQLEEIVSEVSDSLEYLAALKSIKIDISVDEKLPGVKVDKEEIKKVIFNILENAIVYTREKGEIFINCYKTDDNEAVICISDNGPGIKPEIEKIIFQRYAMAKVIERKIGSGLSLYLSKLIIEAHGGKIWYETKLEKGTIFCFLLKSTDTNNSHI